jgi:hypothetical protein
MEYKNSANFPDLLIFLEDKKIQVFEIVFSLLKFSGCFSLMPCLTFNKTGNARIM